MSAGPLAGVDKRWWHAHVVGDVQIGEGSNVAPDARLDGSTGPIRVGRRCEIHPGALLLAYGGHVTLGDDCSVNPYTILYGHGGLTIGNGVRIAAHTVIIPSNHVFADRNTPIRLQPVTRLGVHVGDDVWIGAHVTVLDGVHIGSGTVVAAGSVVTNDVEPFSVVAGIPARRIRER
jgi:acetyltransferase-like isoleucine patch superfamily enzyme